jgi:hypothetical protein
MFTLEDCSYFLLMFVSGEESSCMLFGFSILLRLLVVIDG